MSEQPTVVVAGHAERTVDPDRFSITGDVSVRAADSTAALGELAQRFATLDHAVLALGADGITVERGAVHSYGEGGRLRRWNAGRSLSVTCTDTARATEVAQVFERVPDVQLNGPFWQVDRANPAYDGAQSDAVRDARARAERYAVALGGELGRLVELRDQGTSAPMHFAAAMRAKGEAFDGGLELIDLSPQQQTISASVEARWYLVLP